MKTNEKEKDYSILKRYTVQFAKPVKDKTYWPMIGRAFEEEDRIVISLDSMPLEKTWDGKLFLYPYKTKEETKPL